MRLATRSGALVLLLLAGTLAGCAAPTADAPSRGPLALLPLRFELFAAVGEAPATAPAGEIEMPAGPEAPDAEADLDDEFDLLERELGDRIVVADPLEGWNRAMFELNDALYFAIVKPFLEAYNKAIPEKIRIALRNFFRNLGTPARLVNCMLQGKWEAAETELFRFAVNTTVGCLGFWDAAADIHDVHPVNEDLGQTLGFHGVANGCYLVWPLLGSSTLRDSVGFVGDQFLNPVRYFAPWPVTLGLAAVRITNEGSFHLGTYEALKADAVDPYVAVRQAYIQYRAKQVAE